MGPLAKMGDGTQDTRKVEQEALCVRYVDDDLQPKEAFVGLFSTTSSTGQAMGDMINDAMLRLNLPSSQLRGQAYDGAANMSGVHRA